MRSRRRTEARVVARICACASLVVTPAAGAQVRTETNADEQGQYSQPRIRHAVEAVYPAGALLRSEGAVVRLAVDIDEHGHVTAAHVEESSEAQAFDDAALNAIRGYEFDPATRNGSPVAAHIHYRYRFTPHPRTPVTALSPVPAASSSPGPETSSAPPPASAASSPPASSSSSPPPGIEQGVTIYAHAPSREIGQRELTGEEILRLPGTRGDALLAVQDLPGVARPQFGLGQFVVRSSAPQDTIVLLENQPIALPFHFEGLASTIATDLIDRVEFMPGNFTARYGRASGGVINVVLRPPARDRIHLNVDLDVIDAGAYGSMPLGSNASAAIGIRRSFIDLIGPAAFSSAGGTSFREWPFFWDGQLMFDWRPTARDSFRVVAAASEDQLILNFADPNSNDPNVRGQIGTELSYYGLQARWQHRFSDNVIHTFAPAVSYNISSGSIGPEVNFTFKSVVFSLRDELEVRFSPHARAFVGIDSQFAILNNVVQAPPVPSNGIEDPIDPATIVTYSPGQQYSFSPGLYAETEVDPVRNVRFVAGARVDSYTLLHATTLDPRTSVRIALHPRVVLRAGFGQYSSPPRGYYIVPGFGNPNLVPERWYHMTVGCEMEVIPGIVYFDTDVFVKLGDQVVTATDASENGTPLHFANTGLGRVIGAEWMLRLRPSRSFPIYGLISYTYQHAEREAASGQLWVTYDYDQPHILSASVGAVLPFGFEAGIRVRYTSGLVTPSVTGALYDADSDVALTLTDPLNPGRLPDFFSLDWRVAKSFRVGPIRGQAIVEVLNTTNNNNAESVIYSYDRRSSQYIYGLPIIPSIGLRAQY